MERWRSPAKFKQQVKEKDIVTLDKHTNLGLNYLLQHY